MIRLFVFFLFSSFVHCQTLNLNNTFFEESIRRAQLNGDIDDSISFTIRPLSLDKINLDSSVLNIELYSPTVLSFLKNKGKLKVLPLDVNLIYSSHHPYNRNNGSLIPARGFQQLTSFGIYVELGPLSFQFKPENIYSENKNYDGFWEGHYDIIWERRYQLWNRIDLPERFGENSYKKNLLGQSSIRLNYKSISLGLSSENIWWGPSIRNGIMMSNHAQGFNHITFNSTKPISTLIGNFEFQFVTGRLENSGFNPPSTDRTSAGKFVYQKKINQIFDPNDWRFFQGYSFTYSPKWISGLHFGFSRWVQMYGALFENKYTWMTEANNGATVGWFPIFNNFLRKNDKIVDYEAESDQAASVFFRWVWKDSKAEVYTEYAHNDSKFNLRDLLSDSDHSRAVTLGIHKLFDSQKNSSQWEFQWEWTQMEQTASRLVRNAGSWYAHGKVYHGYTNNGEVMGAGIGPGSNSQYFSLAKINDNQRTGLSLEIIDQDNDFYYLAFEDNNDYRRYWKDFNFHLFYENRFSKFWGAINLVYSRSINYQWELDNNPDLQYYHPGKDVDNFHLNLKLTFPFKF